VDSQESPIELFLPRVAEGARFAADTMQKRDCAILDGLLLGLNCFEPGQSQRVHAHEGADKFYLMLSGKAKITVGDETREVTTGDLVVAPAGIEHGVESALERTVMLVGITR
jgi:uncharacterized cupin superfamily protein